MYRIIDEFGFDPKSFYTLEEYKNLNENYKPNKKSAVLGIVEGKSFVLDGVSRNGRFYPKELWENALKNPEVIQMLQDKLMFGCIGHPENYTLDDLLAEGKVSHIVTDIRLGNDGYGYAIYEILDTPAGRILYTVLKAGAKLKVSTRAFGEFVNEYKEIDGRKYQVINPKNFVIESIDFVIKPGIAAVDVKLVEEIEKKNSKDLEKLKEGKIRLCEDGVCTIIDEVELHKKIEKKYNEEVEKYKSIIKNLKEENKNLQDEIINKEENTNNNLKDLLIAEIESYLKEISVLKDKKELTQSLIKFLDSNEINNSIIDTLISEIEKEKSEAAKKIIELLKKYQETINKEDKSKEEILLDFNKEVTEIYINDEVEKIKKEFEENIEGYKNLIKDLSKKIVELNKESILTDELYNTIKVLEKKLLEKDTIKSKLEKKYNLLKEKLNILERNLKEKENSNKNLEENLNNIKQKYESLKENFDVKLEKEILDRTEVIKNKIEEEIKKEESEKFENLLEVKLKDLKFELKEAKKNIEDLEKEVLEKEKIIENLNTIKFNEDENILKIEEKYGTEIQNLKKENQTLFDEIRNYQIKYLKSLYKNVDESIIKETLNNIKDIEKAKNVLEEKELKFQKLPEEQFQIVQKQKELTLAEKLL